MMGLLKNQLLLEGQHDAYVLAYRSIGPVTHLGELGTERFGFSHFTTPE
jgi:hypothetical protein